MSAVAPVALVGGANLDARARRLWASLRDFAHGPAFAYGMLAVLLLRVVWGIWNERDLTPGDTSSYFLYANQWFESGHVNLPWSPLYTAFYGSLMWVTHEPYAVTILHRLVIAFVASMLVLAVFRRLLPPAPAWLASAWWTVLPTNFNTCYEVHLFALLPALACWLVLLSGRGRWARGTALGILCASVVLVRNEMSVAVALLGLACAAAEWRAWRRGGLRPRELLLPYGIPLVAAFALCALAYARSPQPVAELRAGMKMKHTLNMSQVYTFSYEQRHPEYARDPWNDYHELMTRDFGEPLIPLSEMIRRNPNAVAEHFLWNWQLVPIGVEVLLFNCTSRELILSPDYPPVTPLATWPRVLLVLLVCCWLAALVHVARDWDYWWRAWIRPRAWGWIGMAAVVAVTIPVITTQRPRPSYLLALGVALMALTAMSAWVLTHRWRGGAKLARWLPLAMFALVAVASPYKEPTAGASAPYAPRKAHRPLHDMVESLRPYESGPPAGSSAMLGDQAGEAAAYVWKGRVAALDYAALERGWPAGKPLAQILNEQNVGLLYLNERILRHMESNRPEESRLFLNGPYPPEWPCVGGGNEPGQRWRLYVRKAP